VRVGFRSSQVIRMADRPGDSNPFDTPWGL
jgi:hypothetical protein